MRVFHSVTVRQTLSDHVFTGKLNLTLKDGRELNELLSIFNDSLASFELKLQNVLGI